MAVHVCVPASPSKARTGRRAGHVGSIGRDQHPVDPNRRIQRAARRRSRRAGDTFVSATIGNHITLTDVFGFFRVGVLSAGVGQVIVRGRRARQRPPVGGQRLARCRHQRAKAPHRRPQATLAASAAITPDPTAHPTSSSPRSLSALVHLRVSTEFDAPTSRL